MATKLLKLLSILSIITLSIVLEASSAATNINGDKNNSNVGAAAWSGDQSKESEDSAVESRIALPENQESYIELPESPEGEETTSSDDGAGDFTLSHPHPHPHPHPQPPRTCDFFPQICHRSSNPGPDCCWRRCTNVMKDRFNCGRCGGRCRHNQICCRGHCVNPSFDHQNCGSCGHPCKKWETCIYGMCSYA